MTVSYDYPRTAWQDPAFPVKGPAFNWEYLRLSEQARRKPGIVVHYGGILDAPDGDVDEPWDTFDDFLRIVDRGHRAKGYSFAYNFALDQRGKLWQCRGTDYRNAANNGDYFYLGSNYPLTNQNRYTVSVLCVVDSQDRLTPAATERMRKFVREVRATANRDLLVRPHSFYDPTQCPGIGISDQIVRREFESSPPVGETYVNWNPSDATVASVKDAPPVAETLQNKYNDWAMICFLKVIQEDAGLPVTGRYDQATAEYCDRKVGG